MTASEPTIKIFFENLAVTGEDTDRLSLSQLDTDFHSHIHGGLRVQVHGQCLPSLGYFGADVVCFNTWLVELENIYRLFEKQAIANYTFDEGEQGQPAFLVEKIGGSIFQLLTRSVRIKGLIQNGRELSFSEDFRDQYLSMKADFLSEIGRFAPNIKHKWLKQVFSGMTT